MIAPYGGGGRQKSEAGTLREESVEGVVQDGERLRQECFQLVIAQQFRAEEDGTIRMFCAP